MPTSIPVQYKETISALGKAGICAGYLAVLTTVFGLAAYDARVAIWISKAANSELDQSGLVATPDSYPVIVVSYTSKAAVSH